MPDLLNRSAGIGKSKGSPIASWIEVDPADGSVSATGTAELMPLIFDSTFNDTHNVDETFDEGGNRYTNDGTTVRTFDIVFMQLDPATKELGYNYAGKIMQIVKEEHQDLVDGDYQYRMYPYCKVEKSTTKSAQGGQIPYTITVLNNPTDIGVDLTEHASPEFAATLTGTFTVPANQGSKIASITP